MTEYLIERRAPSDLKIGDLLVNDNDGLATMHRITAIHRTFDHVGFDIIHDETGITGTVKFWRHERPEIAIEEEGEA